MIDILMWVVLAVLAGLVVLALVASRRPDRFRVERSVGISAPADRIYPMIADLRVMNTWNPFALRDPVSTGDYSGAASGVGAVHTFAGPKSGTGAISVVEATPPGHVGMRLVMTKPMACDNRIDFNLQSAGATTNVMWAMEGHAPLWAKMVQTVFNMDRMVGRDFETGLAALKAKCEADRAA